METVLDRAHAAMAAEEEDAGARLRFYERLADAELFVLLEAEAVGDRIAPRVFPLAEGSVVLAFDREDRLAGFAEGAAAHAEMTGRVLVPMLAEARLGLGLNLGVAPSEFLLPAKGVAWLAGLLAARPNRRDAAPERVGPPSAAPEALVAALDAKLPGLSGLADHALLAGTAYSGGEAALVLAYVGAREGAEAALARAAGEALIFSGLDERALDVTFLAPGSAAAERFARVALRLDIPPAQASVGPAAPGMDPDTPPRLR